MIWNPKSVVHRLLQFLYNIRLMDANVCPHCEVNTLLIALNLENHHLVVLRVMRLNFLLYVYDRTKTIMKHRKGIMVELIIKAGPICSREKFSLVLGTPHKNHVNLCCWYPSLPTHKLDMLLFPLIVVYTWHQMCAYGILEVGVYIYECFHIA